MLSTHAVSKPLALRLGTAGWSIPRAEADRFPGSASHLVRYSMQMTCAEINSSFYRPHRASTYARWAASTPEDFRFSIKVPKAITHESGLAPTRDRIASFLDELKPLGTKLGPLLLQLPPRQSFSEPQARSFLATLREAAPRQAMALEPRHPGWFTAEAGALLRAFQVALVKADPAPAGTISQPEESGSLAYYRLHGSPRVYYSSYDDAFLSQLGENLHRNLAYGSTVWCVFDNTASGAALGNALTLADRMREPLAL